jgi:3,4-dihydroxy 2-butanone 4-phosphate synthase / GTP cyclohydrolase II
MPGHVFPLRAKPGGMLQRAGHTEAAVDLARLAGLSPAGIICEVMNDDGTMARVPDLRRFAARHGLKMISIARIIDHRFAHERPIRRTVETRTLRPEPCAQNRTRPWRPRKTGGPGGMPK